VRCVVRLRDLFDEGEEIHSRMITLGELSVRWVSEKCDR